MGFTWTDDPLTTDTLIKTVHIIEIRNSTSVLEQVQCPLDNTNHLSFHKSGVKSNHYNTNFSDHNTNVKSGEKSGIRSSLGTCSSYRSGYDSRDNVTHYGSKRISEKSNFGSCNSDYAPVNSGREVSVDSGYNSGEKNSKDSTHFSNEKSNHHGGHFGSYNYGDKTNEKGTDHYSRKSGKLVGDLGGHYSGNNSGDLHGNKSGERSGHKSGYRGQYSYSAERSGHNHGHLSSVSCQDDYCCDGE